MNNEFDTSEPLVTYGRSNILLPELRTFDENISGNEIAAAFLDSFWKLNGPDFDGGYGRFAAERLDEEVLVLTADKPLIVFRSLYMPVLNQEKSVNFSKPKVVARHTQSVLTPSPNGWRDWENLLFVQRDLIKVPYETDPIYIQESIDVAFPGSTEFLRSKADHQSLEYVWTSSEYSTAVRHAIKNVIQLSIE